MNLDLHTSTGLPSYDVAGWTGWTPSLDRVFRRGGLGSVNQIAPARAERNETNVPRVGDHVLLFFADHARQVECQLDNRPMSIRTTPWSYVLLPEGSSSWWLSTCEVVDKVFHLHLDPEVFRAVNAEAGREPDPLPLVSAGSDPVIMALAQSLFEELSGEEPPSALYWDAAVTALAVRLARLSRPASPAPTGGLAPWQLRRAMELMRQDLAADLSLAELAGSVRLSPYHFSRAFKRSTGLTPAQWQLSRRVEAAKGLLARGDLPLNEVARSVGYASQGAFGAAFRRLTGVSPAAWRRQARA